MDNCNICFNSIKSTFLSKWNNKMDCCDNSICENCADKCTKIVKGNVNKLWPRCPFCRNFIKDDTLN